MVIQNFDQLIHIYNMCTYINKYLYYFKLWIVRPISFNLNSLNTIQVCYF